MQTINIPQHQRSPMTQQPGPLDWLTPPSVPSAIARLLASIGGGLVAGAIIRCVPWGPQSIALALLPLLVCAIALGFLWKIDRRGCWIALAYALFGAIGCALAVGFGGDGQ
jgi:hypothetical protein